MMIDFQNRPQPLRLVVLSLVLAVVGFLPACSIHKIDVQQGNVITQEMFEKLKLGMEKQRVRHILGTPLIVDPFHRGRWDYVYFYRAGNSEDEQSARLTLYFTEQRLSKIDVLTPLPKEAEVKKPAQSIRR